MADYNSGLPVRPQESTAQFPVEIKDSSNNALIGQKTESGSIPVVLASDQSAVETKLQDGSGNALTSTGGALDVNLKTNEVVGQDTAANSLPVVLASDQTAIPVKNQDGSGTALTSTGGALDVNLKSSDILGQDTMANSVPVTMASDQGPIDVNVVSSFPANPVHDYDTSANIAAGAADDHSYTVATTALRVSMIQAAGSGKIRVDVIDKDGATETTLATGFTSTAKPEIEIWFPNELTIAVGHDLVIRRKNLDNQAQDVFSFINGVKA